MIPSLKSRLIAALTEAIEDGERSLNPNPQLDSVEKAVKALGEQIGFGALMVAAQNQWAERLVGKGYPAGGEFVVGTCAGTVKRHVETLKALLFDIERRMTKLGSVKVSGAKPMADEERRTMAPGRFLRQHERDEVKVEAYRVDRDTPFVILTVNGESVEMTDYQAEDVALRIQRALSMLPSSK